MENFSNVKAVVGRERQRAASPPAAGSPLFYSSFPLFSIHALGFLSKPNFS
jgi:hypothetical protein